MRSDDQTTQPLTDAELESYRQGFSGPYDGHVIRLLAEVDRLRAELSSVRTALINAHEAGMSLGQDVERLQAKNDATRKFAEQCTADRDQYRKWRDQACDELESLKGNNLTAALIMADIASTATIKVKRLQSERDALVRKLGLDWGPDEFGDLSAVPDCAEQISAVMSLHQPTAMSSWGHRTCIECDTPGYYQEWPCPTLVALGFEER